MRLVLILVAAALAGCAAKKYTRDGATEADFKRDSAQCRVIHNQAVLQARDAFGNMTAATVYRDCMEGKGWERS